MENAISAGNVYIPRGTASLNVAWWLVFGFVFVRAQCPNSAKSRSWRKKSRW